MRAFVIGSKELSCIIVDELIAQGHEVLGVYTRDHEPGMHVWHQLGHRSLKEVATAHGIPVHEGMKVNSDDSLQLLASLQLDIVLSCFWSEIFKAPVLGIPRLGIYNFHTAYLPKNRGSRPIPWALIEGDDQCGMTVHRMLTGIDNGPMVAQKAVSITHSDTAKTLYEKVQQAGAELATLCISAFADETFTLTKQDEASATYHPRGEPFGGQLHAFWNEDQKDRFRRAFTFPPFRSYRDAPPACIGNSGPGVYWVTQNDLPTYDLPENETPWQRNDIGNPNERKRLKQRFSSAVSKGIHISESIARMYPIHDVLRGFKVPFVVSNVYSAAAWLNNIYAHQPFRYENGLLEIPALDAQAQDLSALYEAAEAASKKAERDIFVPLISKNITVPTGGALTFSEVHDHFNTPYHDIRT